MYNILVLSNKYDETYEITIHVNIVCTLLDILGYNVRFKYCFDVNEQDYEWANIVIINDLDSFDRNVSKSKIYVFHIIDLNNMFSQNKIEKYKEIRKNVDVVIAVSDLMYSNCGIFIDEIVYNSYYLKLINELLETDSLKEFLYVGSLHNNVFKNCLELVKLMRGKLNIFSNDNFPLDLMGQYDNYELFKLNDKCYLEKFYISKFIFCRTYIGFMSAMINKKLPIAFYITKYEKQYFDNFPAYIINGRDAKSVFRILQHTNNCCYVKNMVLQNYNKILNYTWCNVVEKYDNLIKKMLKEL